jgi:hypothetical protein
LRVVELRETLRDSDIPMNVPFTFSNKQPLNPHATSLPGASAAAWRGRGRVHIAGWSYGGVGPVRGLRGEEGGGVRSGLGEARTILLLHIISSRPSKHPLMVRTYLPQGIYGDRLLVFVSARTKKRHHHLTPCCTADIDLMYAHWGG